MGIAELAHAAGESIFCDFGENLLIFILTGSVALMCAVHESDSSQLNTAGGPTGALYSLSRSHGRLSPGAWPSRHRRRRSAAARRGTDRQSGTTTTSSLSVVSGASVLKEEPVQFPITIHSSTAYLVTKIKLYSTFSIYFRVENSQRMRIGKIKGW